MFDPTFSESSFGFRPGRNAHQAIRQVQRHVKGGRSIAVDIDPAKFFDTVNHDVLMNLLARSIADKRPLHLIGRYLRAGVLVGEHIEPGEVGTPQDGPLSPLLANFRHRIKELTGRSWGNTFGGGRRIFASASMTGRPRNWTSGSDGVCVCATGNSGVGRARRSRICWRWA